MRWVPHLQRERRKEGRRARGARARRRAGTAEADASRRCTQAAAACQGTVPCRRRCGQTSDASHHSAARRLRRASGDRRRDGALRVMLKPRALKSGDRLAVVAPASPFGRDEFDRGIAELERIGFEPVFDESVFERRGYVAGTAPLRADAIRRAWRDPSIAGVIGARGGYGSTQVLPLLEPREARRARPRSDSWRRSTRALAWRDDHAARELARDTAAVCAARGTRSLS